jgi:hypothetical protein
MPYGGELTWTQRSPNTSLASRLYISNEVFQPVRVLQVLHIGEAPIKDFSSSIFIAFFSSLRVFGDFICLRVLRVLGIQHFDII